MANGRAAVMKVQPEAKATQRLKGAFNQLRFANAFKHLNHNSKWERLSFGRISQGGEGFPGPGGTIKVLVEEEALSFVIEARVRVRVLGLLDIDEQTNSFTAALEVGLAWEIDDSQYVNCKKFWDEDFRPRLYFNNSVDDTHAPIFDDNKAAKEVASLYHVVSAACEFSKRRAFRYEARLQRRFRRPLHLVNFPFDVQSLPIEIYAEHSTVYGRRVCLELAHPSPFAAARSLSSHEEEEHSDDAKHVFARNADFCDDMSPCGIFGLCGRDLVPDLSCVGARGDDKIDRHKYAVLIFVYRQLQSTLYNLYLPLLAMFVLSFLALCIPPCALADRASVTLTLFLSVIALKTYMADQLPKVPYATAVEDFMSIVNLTLMIQSLFFVAAASFCIKFGIAGQLGIDRVALRGDGNDDGWDCKTEEGATDFWCSNRRVVIQAYIDAASFWLSICLGIYGVSCHLAGRYVMQCERTRAIVKHLEEYERNARQINRRTAERITERGATTEDDADYDTKTVASKCAVVGEEESAALKIDRALDRRRRHLLNFFRAKFCRWSKGYENEQFEHRFYRRPGLEGRTKKKPKEMASCKTILFDCGSTEIKALVASLAKTSQDRCIVKFESKTPPRLDETLGVKDDERHFFRQIGSDGKVVKVQLENLFSSGKGDTFAQWLEDHVSPTFDIVVDRDYNMLEDFFGFDLDDVKQPAGLYVVGKVTKEPPQSRDFVSVELEPGTAIATINGEPFDRDFALARVKRAATLSDSTGFRNPVAHDRVVALKALRFVKAAETTTGASSGSALATTIHDGRPDAVIMVGHKGTVLRCMPENAELLDFMRRERHREHRHNFELSYVVVWDDNADLGETLVEQRKYSTNLDPGTQGLLIKPINEVRLSCISHAEPVAAARPYWRPPKVVVGTGAWYRTCEGRVHDIAREALGAIEARHPSWIVQRNTELDEFWCEDLALRYAYQLVGEPVPDAVLATGKSWTRFSRMPEPDLRDKVIFEDNAAGVKDLKTGVVSSRRWLAHKACYEYEILLDDQDHSFKTTEAVIAVPDSPNTKLIHFLETGTGAGEHLLAGAVFKPDQKLGFQLENRMQLWRKACRGVIDDLRASDQLSKTKPRLLAVTSSAFHAANLAHLLGHLHAAKDKYGNYGGRRGSIICVRDAKRAYENCLKWAYDTANRASSPKAEGCSYQDLLRLLVKEARVPNLKKLRGTDLPNLAFQIELLEALFDDETVLHIVNEWSFEDGGVRCKVTWTMGWYVDFWRQVGRSSFFLSTRNLAHD